MKKGKRLRQTVIERGTKFLRAIEMLSPAHTYFTPTDYEFMVTMARTSMLRLTAGGRQLMMRLESLTKFYKSINPVIVKSICPETSYKPGIHKFLDDFVKHYLKNNGFRESLVVTLAHTYVSKCNGVSNPPYSTKVLIFFMALSAGGNKVAFELVSGNLCGASLRHMQRLACKIRSKSFIDLDST